MKKLTKVFCCALVVYILLGVNVSALYINKYENVKSEEVALTDSDYYYPESISVSLNINGYYVDSVTKNSVIGHKTKHLGIYLLSNGQFLSCTGAETYQVVELIDVSLSDRDYIESVIQQYDLKGDIANQINEAVDRNTFLRKEGTSMTLAVSPTTSAKGSYNVDYTYNGVVMRDTLVFFYNDASGFKDVQRGLSSKQFASAAYSITLIGVGFIFTSPIVQLVAGGLSLLDWFASYIAPTTFSATGQDFVQLNIVYDVQTKYTYYDLGQGWQSGLVTQTVKINKLQTYQKYMNYSTGNLNMSSYSPYKRIYSPNYNNAPAACYNNIGNVVDVERLKTVFGSFVYYY
jgi:hypothetical protein